ncbi:MAG: transcriptional repressor [Candidatus Omnitrophica bacterium]|nr:transcriptional repressor [Candidatus Omnitrophota bacterium]
MPRGFGRGFRHGFGGPPWWAGRFAGAGYRMTIPRQEILHVLNTTDEHLSAEDIYLKVRKVYPGIGLTTVYRTLELLVDMDIIRKFDFGDDRARYELAIGPKGVRHHHHLVCENCGRIIDYKDFVDEEKELLDKAEKGLSKKFDFEIKDHFIRFYGLCDKCQKRR